MLAHMIINIFVYLVIAALCYRCKKIGRHFLSLLFS